MIRVLEESESFLLPGGTILRFAPVLDARGDPPAYSVAQSLRKHITYDPRSGANQALSLRRSKREIHFMLPFDNLSGHEVENEIVVYTGKQQVVVSDIGSDQRIPRQILREHLKPIAHT